MDDAGEDREVALDSLSVGDKLRVRPGEKVPVDGVMIEGRSAVDESLVTGESMPVTKEAGAKVIAGTLNQSGGFVMRAEKVGRDTLLSQIVQMVAQAQRSRAPIQRLADHVAWGSSVAEESLAGMTQSLAPVLGPDAEAGALHRLAGMVQSQALVMSFADIFLILALLFAVMVFLVPLVQAPKAGAGAAAH